MNRKKNLPVSQKRGILKKEVIKLTEVSMVRAIRKIKRKTAKVIIKHRKYYRSRLTAAQDKKRRKRMTAFLLGLAAVLLVTPWLLCLRHKFLESQLSQEDVSVHQTLHTIANIVHRHHNGYPEYCKKKGHLLVNYPIVFTETFKSDLIVFNTVARKNNLTPAGIMTNIQREFASVSEKAIQKEFKKLTNGQLKTVDGKTIRTEKELCQYIDANPKEWINRHQPAIKIMQEAVQSLQVED